MLTLVHWKLAKTSSSVVRVAYSWAGYKNQLTLRNVLDANQALCFGRTWGLEGSRPSQKKVAPPIFGQESRRNWLFLGGDSRQPTVGTKCCIGWVSPVKHPC